MGSESVGVLLVVALEDGVGWTSPLASCMRQTVCYSTYVPSIVEAMLWVLKY